MNDRRAILLGVAVVVVILGLTTLYSIYSWFRIDVPAYHIAVLTRLTGEDLDNGQSIAPDEDHKGVQTKVLTEGRYFYNGYTWTWNVVPMIEIPSDKMGVRVRLYGENLPYGHFLATKETEKGVIPEVLRPGRYPINATVKGQEKNPRNNQAEMVELYDPITIPAGFRGVVTNLAGPIPEDPNVLLVKKGDRGVQKETLDAGTYYLNPYLYRVDIVDCRSQRFNLAETTDMGFPSKDGFWVTLDGIIEFRVDPERAAEVFVIYNDAVNDNPKESTIQKEIVQKIIMPNARSFCRLRGSNAKGRDFIGGDTRTAFQKEFGEALVEACNKQGVEVLQALITKINPPQQIALPVREREVARQKLYQYKEQIEQQKAEANLAIETAMIGQRKELVDIDQIIVKGVTKAKQQQQVEITKAKENKKVAQLDLDAAKDQAAAVFSQKQAEAKIIQQENIAEAAGWKKAIDALGGDGMAYARYVLNQKLAPSFRQMMVNTSDSPLMDVFRGFGQPEVIGQKKLQK